MGHHTDVAKLRQRHLWPQPDGSSNGQLSARVVTFKSIMKHQQNREMQEMKDVEQYVGLGVGGGGGGRRSDGNKGLFVSRYYLGLTRLSKPTQRHFMVL